MARQIRFSLGSLLIVTFVCCLLLGWFGWTLRKSERLRAERQQAIARFTGINGRVMGWSEVGPTHVGFQGIDFSGAKLEELRKAVLAYPDIVHVLLHKTTSTDAALAELSRLKQIEELQIRDSTLSDEGLRHIGAMQSLRQLSVTGGEFTDEGLRHLEALKQLDWMTIGGQNVTMAGATHLKNSLPNVKVAIEPQSGAN